MAQDIFITPTSGTINFNVDNNIKYQISGSGDNLIISGSGDVIFLKDINIDGNVGIGTRNPIVTGLHIWNNVSASAFYGDGSNLSNLPNGSNSPGNIEFSFAGAAPDMTYSPKKFVPANISASLFLATCDSGSCYVTVYSDGSGGSGSLAQTFVTGNVNYASGTFNSSNLNKFDKVYLFISESRNCYNLSVAINYKITS